MTVLWMDNMELPSMTMQVKRYTGVNLTDQLNVTEFNLEWGAETIAEISNMEPPAHMLAEPIIGKLHFSFRNMEAGRQIETAAMQYGVYPDNSLIVKVQLSENNWVLYHESALISIQTFYADDPRVNTTWTYERTTGSTEPPRELQKRLSLQKLDWKSLGF